MKQAGADITGQLQVRPMLYTLYIDIAKDMPKICQRYTKDIPKISKIYIVNICQKFWKIW